MTNYIGPDEIIKRKKEYLYPCSHHFYSDPPQIVKGHMQYLYDSSGKEYLDFFSGVSVTNCGHCNPTILEATIDQLKTLQHTTTIYLTQPIVDLAKRLAQVLPGDLKHSFFCTSGSEANEGALLLARLHTGKKGFITLENSLHGRTYLTMNCTSIPMWRADPYLSDVVTIAPNWFDYNKSLEESARESLDHIGEILKEKSHDIAALIVEPIQGNGGIMTPPKWYFKELKNLLEAHNVLLIVDEVQTGFARTGKMFAIENFHVVPDIITMAKALGNGVPISAFCTSSNIAKSFVKPSASTLGGNPVAAKTALAVLNYIEDNNLCDKAAKLGDYLKEGLLNLKDKYPIIKDIRGIGLMLGAELLNDDGSYPTPEVDLILENLKDRGIFIGKNGIGRNVLAFQPPLIISKENIDFLLSELDAVLMALK